MDAKEEIRQRLSVEEVVGDYVQLKRAGRNFKALSPFTNEKTPSFMVSPEKQIWHDFSSGRGGDMFTFIMEVEGVDFVGALEILARKANIDLSKYRTGGTSSKKKERIIEAHELAVRYYQQTLMKNKSAWQYLTLDRGFTKEIILEFKLGFAPSQGDALVKFLLSRKFSAAEILEAGLATNRSGAPRDMFRGRIMVPLLDGQGRCIGFTGRILGEGEPKYLNTASTLAYDKSGHIFGLSMAKETIRTEKFVVVVEGNMDVVAAHMAGTKNVVAVAGTAMTTRHLVQLARLAQDVRLAFDNDSAGLNATKRSIEVAQDSGVTLSVINIVGGKDPDDVIKNNPAVWRNLIKSSIYAVDWVIETLSSENDLATATGKKVFSDTVLRLLSHLSDAVEKDHFLTAVAKRLGVSKEAILSKLQKSENTVSKSKRTKISEQSSFIQSHSDLLLGMLLRYPELRDSVNLTSEHFSGIEQKQVLDYTLSAERKPIVNTPEELQEIDTYVKIALFRTEELYSQTDANARMSEVRKLALRQLNDYKKRQKEDLTRAIAAAEVSGDDHERIKLLTKFNLMLKGEKNDAGTR